MKGPLRVLPDSNIVFSATRDVRSHFLALWSLPAVDILISQYIITEVSRHFPNPEFRNRLWQLVYRSHLVPDGREIILPEGIALPPKDRPILQSAIAGGVDIMVTGDKKHFGSLFGSKISGVLVESATAFKSRYPLHFPSKEEVR